MKTMSLETKMKISKSRKKFLKENPDSHPWKHNRMKSNPCELVKEYLKTKDIGFIEEFQPIEDRFFSIDIAFPDKRIGIEINGNQHYDREGKLKKYYQERHDLIESFGWKIIELHYSLAYKLHELENIMNFEQGLSYDEYTKEHFHRRKQKEEHSKQLILDNKRLKEEARLKYMSEIKEELLESNIQFSKLGWVQKSSEIIGIAPQKVNVWMKRNMPDFYEKECFKRKAPKR